MKKIIPLFELFSIKYIIPNIDKLNLFIANFNEFL